MHSDGRPTGPHAAVYVFVANTGAPGTVVTRLDATDFQEHNSGPPIWAGISRLDMPIGGPVAIVLERDDAKPFPLAAHLAPNTDMAVASAEEFARRLRGLKSVTFTLRWEWRRPNFPDMRRREIATGSQVVTLDGEQFRASMVANWRTNSGLAHSADIAEGREPETE